MSKFTTVINATGPAGNIFSMLGAAQSLMRQLKVDQKDVAKLAEDVMAAGSYNEACGLIEEWFPIEREAG